MIQKNILIVVGTRPNFIKITRFKAVVAAKYTDRINIKIVHTGQHFDHKMADVFFQQLNIYPDFFLDIPAARANIQMGEIMIRLEKIITDFKPEMMLVVGDVNSTFAAALTGNKLGVKIAHIESGLRSFDRGMPEEINRILTDEISDIYFITEESVIKNLKKEGKPKEAIHFVGNTMIDTLVAFEDEIDKATVLEDLGLLPQEYVLMTMHRPSNVDELAGLMKLVQLLKQLSADLKVVFPIHPRTVKKLKESDLYSTIESNPKIIISEPLDYFSFQKLIANCFAVITDSGCIQEETTYKQVPCLTLRANTERPSTIKIGSNILLNFEVNKVMDAVHDIRSGNHKKGNVPPLWDGKATERIVEALNKII
ncbi:UDP-N-acetylglucosamine 2-epimerase (non-hydrolyzing) [Pontibacter sp. E15-1]|uniref:non-hydrolyzing UDP-N-acetylglucosamine 2-epimerase n=1 Tax=Pontibacter sp. E15-1 TaxID=2919918 RepID=UPI001F4F92F4|nr:UDP-N-acetylglucosamine 2-epimerase (non-hydrolyzing) [Pontibacter sp. E15-1]MCJ8166338.1 UDP-N-acetylglucosamine 2-epimerase (non-hydrolyzing) [Pontibacter sp. E15-1]